MSDKSGEWVKNRQMKVVYLASCELVGMLNLVMTQFRYAYKPEFSGLPKDVVVVAVFASLERQSIGIVVASSEFSPVAAGDELPFVSSSFVAHQIVREKDIADNALVCEHFRAPVHELFAVTGFLVAREMIASQLDHCTAGRVRGIWNSVLGVDPGVPGVVAGDPDTAEQSVGLEALPIAHKIIAANDSLLTLNNLLFSR